MALVDYAQQSMRTRSRAESNVADHGSLLLFDHQAHGIEGLRLNDGGPDGDDEIWLTLAHPPAPEVPPKLKIPGSLPG